MNRKCKEIHKNFLELKVDHLFRQKIDQLNSTNILNSMSSEVLIGHSRRKVTSYTESRLFLALQQISSPVCLVKDVSILPCLLYFGKGGRVLDFRVPSVRLLPFMVKRCFELNPIIPFIAC